MILESLNVTNFLSVIDETLRFEELTVLVGSNGSGKSAFLKALDYFFTGSPKISGEDFHARDSTRDIEITLTFSGLSDSAKQDFQKYVENERFSVTRVLSLANPHLSGKYFGSTLQHAAFASIRSLSSAKEKREAYQALRQQSKYSDLPEVSKQDQIEPALIAWEEVHSQECERRRDSGQFLGYTGVGQGSLRRHIRFVLVPAVREAAREAEESRSSPISELLDLVVRSRMAVHSELETLRQETQLKLKELVSPGDSPGLDNLGGALSQTLQQYATDTAVSLRWLDLADLTFPQPKALVMLREHGFECTVDRAGHGLQRALIVTLLQHLEAERHLAQLSSATGGDGSSGAAESAPPGEAALPGLFIAIEEPELYQHPNRQRQISSVLLRLAKGEIPGVAGRTQIAYSTHSPLLVSLDRMDQVRRASRAPSDTGVKKTVLRAASLDNVAEQLWDHFGRPGTKWTAASLRPRLEVILNPWMNEGFFSDLVVLVEGESDRAALLAHAALKGQDLEAQGISVIPCDGKCSMDRPSLVFQNLGIPTYLVWDNDQGEATAKPDTNRLLCRILGRTEEEYPSFVEASGACIAGNLEKLLGAELADYAARLEAECEAQGLGLNEGRKKPGVVRALLRTCSAEGSESGTLSAITGEILKKRQGLEH